MELFRKKLKARMMLICLILLIFVLILLYNQFLASDTLRNSLSFSFQCGFSAAGALVLAFVLFKYRRALASEERLRLLFNQENDERMKAIRAKAGVPMVLVLSIVLVLAGMIAGYFDETIFVVLIGAALFQLTASMLVKFYYMKKM